MIFLAIGLPGRFADWCGAVMSRLAAGSGGAVASMTFPPLEDMFGFDVIAPTLDELGRLLIGNTGRHIVICARQPDARLRTALSERAARFVVVLDDPRHAAADILGETDADPKRVVRAIANSCPMVMQFCELPGSLTLHAERTRIDPAAAVSAIAAHFGIAVEPDAIAAIVNELAALGIWSAGPEDAEEWAVRLPVAVRKMAEGALLGYRSLFRDGGLDQAIWTRDLFYLAADASRSPTELIDVSGGSRVLIYGPYLHLPQGSWTARVVIGFSQEAAGYAYLIDIFAGAQLASTTFQPDTAGIYHVDLTFSLGEPSGTGVEVRVMVTSDSARGQLAFGHVILRPLVLRHAGAASLASDDFSLALAI
jgi:hypothetical protein